MSISKEKRMATIDLLAKMVVEDMARQQGISEEEAFILFLTSPTAAVLYGDEESKLWWDGPAALAT